MDVTTISSNYHIELNPSESGHQDKVVVQEVIKEIAQSQPLESTPDTRLFKGLLVTRKNPAHCRKWLILR